MKLVARSAVPVRSPMNVVAVVVPETFTFCKKVALVFVLMFSVQIPVTVEIPAPNVTVRLSPKLTVAAVPTAVPLS